MMVYVHPLSFIHRKIQVYILQVFAVLPVGFYHSKGNSIVCQSSTTGRDHDLGSMVGFGSRKRWYIGIGGKKNPPLLAVYTTYIPLIVIAFVFLG